jgi:hypothetical protein
LKKLNRFNFTILCFVLLFGDLGREIFSQNRATAGSKQTTIDTSSQFNLVNDSLIIQSSLKQKINNIVYDSSIVVVRSVDSSKIKSYLRDKDFKYFEDPESTMTLWERLIDWIKRQIAKLLNLESAGTVWDVFTYLLIAFAVIAIIFGIYKSEIKGLFFSNKVANGLKISESIEDIHSISYESMIEEAIANRNYRFALRLNYLRSLKILSDKEIINWKIDKTNHEFITEIKHNNLKSIFSNITIEFESIWYGRFEINQSHFSKLQLQYKDFNLLLDKYQ